MKSALLLIPLLALTALAQERAVSAPVRLDSIRTSVHGEEVRVDIETTAPLDSPASVVSYDNILILDIPGVIYDRMGQRIQVNKADVQDVRVWMQQQKPPIVRISVSMTRNKVYSLSTEGNHLILQIGPGLRAVNAQRRGISPKQEPIATIPAARASRSVPAAIGAIFTRDPKQPVPISRSQPTNPSADQNSDGVPLSPLSIDEIKEPPAAGSITVGNANSAAAAPNAPNPPAEKATTSQTPAQLAAGRDTRSNAPSVPISAPDTEASAEINLSAATSTSQATAVAAETPAIASQPSAVETATKRAVVPAGDSGTGAGPAALQAGTEPGKDETPRPTSDLSSAENPTIPVVNTIERPGTANAGAFSAGAVANPVESRLAIPPAETPEAIAVSPEAIVSATGDLAASPPVPNANLRTLFHIKFVEQDTAYIDGGRAAGLTEGMKLLVASPDADGGLPKGISPGDATAELVVIGIAETSAATEIRTPKRDVIPGDLAYLSDAELQNLVQQHSLSSTRKYPVVISFTEDDDALDAEVRAVDVPRAPLPSVNRMEGRFGFDYIGTQSLGSSQSSGKDLGVVIRSDFTRIGGTYWNFRGYWRGRVDYMSAGTQPTLQDLLNRTYHLALTYDNPDGHWVAGFGRMFLPWASSLDTIDGGYFGRRWRPGVITGFFAGSTPDPTSWNYSPNRQIAGTFVNFTGGSFDAMHYSSTSGAGINLLSWRADRPLVFFENSVSYRRAFSIFHALQADSPAGNSATAAPGPGIGSSLLTVRWSPISRLDLDFNDTYFRAVPTFDPRLVGTGLLDKYLFQGLSAGGRVEIVKHISVYTELGRSNRSGDNSSALNNLYGITWGNVPWVNARTDVHYARFNSSFGSGSYQAFSIGRSFRENLHLDLLAGTQAFISTLAGNQTARFLTTTVDSNLGSALFIQSGFTLYRGQQQNYDQWMLTMGYRFDSKRWRR